MKTYLKYLLVVAFFPLVFLNQSCEAIKDEINDIASFDAKVDLPAETVVIDSASYKSSDEILQWNIIKQYMVEVDLQQILDDNNVDNADFSNGKMDSYRATLVSPTGIDFTSFTSQMKVTAATDPNFSDEIEVAITTSIDPGAQSVEFDVYDLDITSYIKAPAFYLRIWAYKTSQLPVDQVEIQLQGSVEVNVSPL
jgi:hypothetical protein